MTPRERTLAVLLHRPTDKVPFNPGHPRKSTRARWFSEGFPESEKDVTAYLLRELGLPNEAREARARVPVDSRMIPQFEEKVLERRERTQIVQDWKGNVCEISNEFDVSCLRQAIDFVTRRWIRCPVEDRAGWEEMRRRYNPLDASRRPADFADWARRYEDRAELTVLDLAGPFWQLREWLGAERLCELFIEDPGWTREMIDFHQEFIAQLMERTFARHVPDAILVNEDLAYKGRAFLSPAMMREYLLPCWRRWCALCREAGVRILEVDSDGHVGEALPLWLEAGFNCNSPQEVVAGNDLPEYARRFGKRMAYRGGVCKQKIAAGGAAIRAELERLAPVIRSGGYIPGCDHGVPSDVSWPGFLEYSRLLARATGWL